MANPRAIARALARSERAQAKEALKAGMFKAPVGNVEYITVGRDAAPASTSDFWKANPNGPTVLSEAPGTGYISLERRGDGLYIKQSSVSQDLRGQGVGVDLYERAIEYAQKEGLPLYSDTQLTNDSRRIYPALGRRGYDIENIGTARVRDDGRTFTVSSRDERPLYRLGPKTDTPRNTKYWAAIPATAAVGAGAIAAQPQQAQAAPNPNALARALARGGKAEQKAQRVPHILDKFENRPGDAEYEQRIREVLGPIPSDAEWTASWNKDQPLYHGTRGPLEGDHIRPTKHPSVPEPRAISLTPDRRIAEQFGSTVIPVVARGKYLPREEWFARARAYMAQGMDSESAAAAAKGEVMREGYTGVRMSKDEIAVFEPHDVRSPDAAFDPKQKYSPDMMAGLALTAGVGGAGAVAMAPQEAEAAPLNADAIRAARQVFRKADDVGFSRNHARGMMKFGADGMTPEARMARARGMGASAIGAQSRDATGLPLIEDAIPPVMRDELTTGAVPRQGAERNGEYIIGDDLHDLSIDYTNALQRRLARFQFPEDAWYSPGRREGSRVSESQYINPIVDFPSGDQGSVKVRVSAHPRNADQSDFRVGLATPENTNRMGAFADQIAPVEDVGGRLGVPISQVNETTAGVLSRLLAEHPQGPFAALPDGTMRSVNATFDPARANRRDLLAGIAGAAGAGTVAAAAMQPQEAEAAPRVPKGITAYHGSPHTFDRFDMSKIGTGEGFQTYGHGLYFAENEAVARAYRNKLAGQEGSMYEVNLDVSPDELIDLDAPYAQQSPAAQAFLARRLRTQPRPTGDGFYDLGNGFNLVPEQPLFGPQRYRLYQDGKRQSRTFASPEEAIPEFMDDPNTAEAGDLLGRFSGDPVAQRRAAQEAGIKGLQYRDQLSRGTDGGTRNYVMFDDKLVDIKRRYAVPGAIGAGLGAGATAATGAQPQQANAAELSALTRAIAGRRRDQERRQFGERVNATADQTLDVLGFVDPTGGFASETVRSLKDLPQQGAGLGGTLALAPLDAAQRTLGGIGALPELGVAGGRAIARAIARAPQPRGSATYRRTK